MELIYSFVLVVVVCLMYVALLYVIPSVFNTHRQRLGRRSAASITLLALFIIAIQALVYIIPNIELGNRILHTFGGGFLAFVLCFLVVKDTHLTLTRLQFFILSMLVVTTLGVGNELLEFTLQQTTGFIFAPSITDTWLDLTSNTVGALIASVVFLPLVKQRA